MRIRFWIFFFECKHGNRVNFIPIADTFFFILMPNYLTFVCVSLQCFGFGMILFPDPGSGTYFGEISFISSESVSQLFCYRCCGSRSEMIFFRTRVRPPLLVKFSYIIFRILVVLFSLWNWAALKTYSWNRKQQDKGIFGLLLPSGMKKFSDPDLG
jgi:hypothetical protein